MTEDSRVLSAQTSASALKVIQRHHRRTRLSMLIWSLGTMLLALAVARSDALAPWKGSSPASWGLALISALLLARWLQHFARVQETDTARALDRKWQLQARLESTLELQADPTAFAEIQRVDTAERVAIRREPLRVIWFTGLSLLAFAAVILLTEVSGWFAFHFHPKSLEPIPPKAAAGSEKPDSRIQNPDTFADIRWLSPAKTLRASSIEEVWLKAAATSAHGFVHATLEISVNGGPTKSLAINPEAGAALAQPGEQQAEVSLYLDELSVNDYDVVSYFLKAEAAGNSSRAPATSPLQFIQIRPANETVAKSDQEGKQSEFVSQLYALQAAQLELLQQNFLLVHTGISHRESDWTTANASVGAGQVELSPRATELRKSAIGKEAPARIVDDLGQAADAMKKAGNLLHSEENPEAIVQQQQALALLADCDRVIHKTQSQGTAAVADPFPDQQKLDLPDRAKTIAGKLDSLSAQQDKIVNQLAEGSSAGEAAAKSRQASIAKELSDISESPGLSPATRAAAQRAAKEAASAAARLAASDAKSALPPAAAASAALHEAIENAQKDARDLALALMESNRRILNDSARIEDPTTRNHSLAAVAADLREGAIAQQAQGSQEVAADLAKLAQEVHASAHSAPASFATEQVAQHAAGVQVGVAGQRDAIDRALRQLDRGRRELTAGDEKTGRADLELAAQMSRELLTLAGDKSTAEKLLHALRADVTKTILDVLPPPQIISQALSVQQALNRIRDEGKRDERVRRFNSDTVDPAYRPSVETYFKTLSRGDSSK